MKVYKSDRNWLERIKRNKDKKNFQDTFKAVKKVMAKHKMESEVE